eukprot:UN28196
MRRLNFPVETTLEDFHTENCALPQDHISKSCKQVFVIIFYCTSSITLTLYNKWILNNFKFPITMILFHQTFISVGCTIIIKYFFVDKWSELDDWITKIEAKRFVKLILPVAIFFSSDIVFSQIGLMLSSVTLAEIVKSTIPVLVFVLSVTLGFEPYDKKKCVIMGCISIGVLLTTMGEVI